MLSEHLAGITEVKVITIPISILDNKAMQMVDYTKNSCKWRGNTDNSN